MSYDPRNKSIMREIQDAAGRMIVVARNADIIEDRFGHGYDQLVEDIRTTQTKIIGLLGELREQWQRLKAEGQQLTLTATMQERNLGTALMDIEQTLRGSMERIEGKGGRQPWRGQTRG